MKKLYNGLLTLALACGLAACGPATGSSETPVEDPEAKVLVDTNVPGYAVLGPNTWHTGTGEADDDYIKDWGGYDGTGPGTMEATSIKDVRAHDTALADAFKAKGVVALYKIEGLSCADTKIAPWRTTYGDDAKVLNGAYCLKVGSYNVDEEEHKNVVDTWIPSKESGKVLTLTPDRYWVTPNFAEEVDEHGYDWNTNPVVTSGAGTYNVYFGRFAEAQEDALYGIGIVKTADKTEYEPPLVFQHWKLTGTINGKAFNETEEAGDTYATNAEGVMENAKLKANDEFKVTKMYDYSRGTMEGALTYANLTEDSKAVVEAGTDGNIKIKEDAAYKVTVDEEANTIKVEKVGPYLDPVFDHWKITGNMQGWNPAEDTEGYAFSKDGKLTCELKAADGWKITKWMLNTSNKWDNGELSWGNLSEASKALVSVAEAGSDIKVLADNTYDLAIREATAEDKIPEGRLAFVIEMTVHAA